MIEKANAFLEENFNKQIEFLKTLIKFNSVLDNNTASPEYPFGKPAAECLKSFLEQAQSYGCKIKNIDNMTGYAEIGNGDLIGILAHLDIVPAGDLTKWTYPPFDCIINDNKLYGRGTIDDKGPLAAAFFAMLALKESGIKLNKRFRLIAGTDEETSFRCIERYKQTEEIPVFSFSPDAYFPAVHAERGQITLTMKRTFELQGYEPIKLLGITSGERVNIVPDTAAAYFSGDIAKLKRQLEETAQDDLEIEYYKDIYLQVTAKGKAAHAMHPEKGENAMGKLMKYLAHENLDYGPWELMLWIRSSAPLINNTNGSAFGIDCRDDISGNLTINPGIIRYKGKDLTLKFDIRYPVTEKPAKMEKRMRNIADKMTMLAQISKHLPPLYVDKDNKYLNALLASYEKNTGDKSGATAIGGRTYCSALPNAVSFGASFPKDEERAHQANEFIDLNKFKLTSKIYLDALLNLNNM